MPLKIDGIDLGEVERHRREPGAADGGDAVFREELSQHRGVLIGD